MDRWKLNNFAGMEIVDTETNTVYGATQHLVDKLNTLTRELAEARKFNQDMVAKVAENRLGGYRELGQKLADCEAKLAVAEAKIEKAPHANSCSLRRNDIESGHFGPPAIKCDCWKSED